MKTNEGFIRNKQDSISNKKGKRLIGQEEQISISATKVEVDMQSITKVKMGTIRLPAGYKLTRLLPGKTGSSGHFVNGSKVNLATHPELETLCSSITETTSVPIKEGSYIIICNSKAKDIELNKIIKFNRLLNDLETIVDMEGKSYNIKDKKVLVLNIK
jgi:hypothetical protein